VTRPGPVRGARPWRPHLPHAPPSLYLIFFSRATTSSPSLPPLFHLLCPRCDPVDGCHRSSDPKVSFPSPSSLPPFPYLSPTRGPSPRLPAHAPFPKRLRAPPEAAPRARSAWPCTPLDAAPARPWRGLPPARPAPGVACPRRAVPFPRAALARVTFKI
jgi:hypothetical protein